MKFADFTNKIEGQQMFQILSKAKDLEKKGRDIIHLEIGDPDFKSPLIAANSIKKAIDNNNTHYVQSSGLPEFKEAAKELTYKSRGFLPEDDQILVTCGANIQIYLAISCLVNPGDEVIIPDPSFVSYISIIKANRAIPRKVKLNKDDNFSLSINKIKASINERTRAIIVNSPHNPTGSVLKPETLRSIYDLCKENDIALISDEVYGRLVYKNSKEPFFSPTSIDNCKHTTLLIHSLSKTYSMTGWRIGAVTGPKELIKRMSLLFETMTSCVPPFIQIAAIDTMKNSQPYTFSMLDKYTKRRDILVKGLNKIKGISCQYPDGTFYAFADISSIKKSSEEFSNILLNEIGVATCPGIFFGEGGEGFVRFCFANSEQNIERAMERMEKLFC